MLSSSSTTSTSEADLVTSPILPGEVMAQQPLSGKAYSQRCPFLYSIIRLVSQGPSFMSSIAPIMRSSLFSAF